MLSRQPVPDSLLLLASRQGGVVTREQVFAHGLTRHILARLVDSGAWVRLSQGVFAAMPTQPTWLGRAWAGVLIGGDRSRLGGLAAAYLHGLVEAPPDRILVLVPSTGRPSVRGPWLFQSDRPGFRAPLWIGAPPRIGIEDTVLDVVGLQRAEGEVVGWVTGASQNARLSVDRLRRQLEARSRMPHRGLVTELLTDVAEGVRSPLELRYRRDVEAAHRLPAGQRQVRRRGTYADVWYREFGLLVELDGRRGHEGTGRFRDMHRDNSATTDGLATLRYGWTDVVGSPCAVARQVAANLALRGWTGTATGCPRCPGR
jgi:hypothetical protein